jgi:hypothetical protein
MTDTLSDDLAAALQILEGDTEALSVADLQRALALLYHARRELEIAYETAPEALVRSSAASSHLQLSRAISHVMEALRARQGL